MWSRAGQLREGPGGYSLKIWVGVCGVLLETLTLFQTKMVKIYTLFQTKKAQKPR